MNIQKMKWKFMILDCCVLLLLFYVSFIFSIGQSSISRSAYVFATIGIVSFCVASYALRFYQLQIESLTNERLLVSALVLTVVAFGAISLYQLNLLTCMSALLFTGYLLSSRISYQFLKKHLRDSKKVLTNDATNVRLLIVGAGQAGIHMAERLKQNPQYKIVGFLDDDYKKIGLHVNEVPILGEISLLKSIAKKVDASQILIAIPSLQKEKLSRLVEKCLQLGIKTQVMPSVDDIVNGTLAINKVRDVKIEDLLGREEVEVDTQLLNQTLQGKKVLVTGAGGSIGSEICRQVIQSNPACLILLGHGENSIYEIAQQLSKVTDIPLIKVIGDIRDRDAMNTIMHKYQPHIVYHAAAHKHVPLMEDNPAESIKNNVFGTKNIADAAKNAKVERFVMISSDKAVDPPNIMGATKRVAELVIQQLAKNSTTKFAVVRFGNVLGSRGSVIPLFQKQIQKGGPITLTDARMTRYFMTIPEAARLVLQASSLSKGGEVFILDMGEPVKIMDLAKNLIRLSGLPLQQIQIVETGIRPGEKLHEVLLGEHEKLQTKVFNKIFVGQTTSCSDEQLQQFLTTILYAPEFEIKERLLTFANYHVEQQEDEYKWKFS